METALIADSLMTIKEASEWASDHIGKNVTPSNISYLIQYGRVKKIGENGSTQISKNDLQNYYLSYNGAREINYKERLGEDLNWALSFEQYKEAETTKHVHRLHPYKGKFIPQLVEYFLDDHVDNFKTKTYFHKGDIVLDPFAGSGTTLVQASELGIHAIGIDISAFNALISNSKVTKYDIVDLKREIKQITDILTTFIKRSNIASFEERLLQELNIFNNLFFPVPDYKYRVRNGMIDEAKYGNDKERIFAKTFESLAIEYGIELETKASSGFLDKWYFRHIRDEIDVVFNEIKKIQNVHTKQIVSIILSRTIRSCRATTHADLATLLEPIRTTYYCSKHGKMCKPLFSMLKWWKSYAKDTVDRLLQFDQLRTNTYQLCLAGDSRDIDILQQVTAKNSAFGELLKRQQIKGIFSSPPYLGLIDYHEQHAYAYELFGFERKDELEIGSLVKGTHKEAKQNYAQDISAVLKNCKNYLAADYDVFLVANDKYNLYPTIAENAGMRIVDRFKRPVLNRTEKDKTAYSETIFHLKENDL